MRLFKKIYRDWLCVRALFIMRKKIDLFKNDNLSKTITKLRTITDEDDPITLEQMLRKIDDEQHVAYYKYDKEDKEFHGRKICYEQDFAIQHIYMKKDYTVPNHVHAETEFGIVLKGEINTKIGKDEWKVYKKGDVFIFDPDAPHTGIMLEDSEILVITVPPSPAYPK